MNHNNGFTFNWDELLQRIRLKKVIPVIGHGLYRIEKEGKERLLYDYLAERIAEETGISSLPEGSHKFSKAAFQFLKGNRNNLELTKFLNAVVKEETPAAANPLWKLARIKAFHIFINTAYDDFLADTIKSVRAIPTETHSYTLREKKLNKLDNNLFDNLDESKATLVFNIYGNLKDRIDSAFTERDILETIVEFQKDMKAYPENNLFQELKDSSLLFIGCGYDDWLFRFFIRTVANAPYSLPKDPYKSLFFADDCFDDQKALSRQLPRFLKSYESQIFCPGGGKDFVDTLFEKLEKELPEEIIPVTDFPAFAFISFHGANRAAAVRLAANLREDGIDVWLDEAKLEPGDQVDDTIAKAIARCPVFIPLVSQETKTLQAETGVLKYHVREWEWALGSNNAGNNPRHIIPVNIDGSGWTYDKFAGLFYVTVIGGARVDGYDDLKTRLLNMQRGIDG